MGFFASLKNFFARLTSPEQPQRGALYFPGKTPAGVRVDHFSALQSSAVWACVRVISESIAQMGAHVYQPVNADRAERVSHPVDYLLDKQANEEMSAFTFRETLLAWALTWGNGYAEIERDTAGRASWLWPIPPDRVNPDRTQDGDLVYDIANRGKSNIALNPSDVFHLHGLGFDGTMGYSVIGLARKAIGLGLATEEFGSTFFGNGTHLGVVLEHPARLTPEAQANLAKSLTEKYSGTKNAFKMAILEEGMKWHQIGIPPEDAQFIESRKFQIHEICRWFRVPPHKLADLERATFSNIEHQSIEFVTDTLVPWVTRFEQECNIKLFGQNRQNLFVRINVAALLRGDLQSRYNAYAIGRQWGWLSVNDVRRLEGQNPLPPEIGDVYLTPLNMGLLSADGKPQRPRVFEQPGEPQKQPPTNFTPEQLFILESARLMAGHNGNGVPPDVHVQVVSPPSLSAVHAPPVPEVTNHYHVTVPERHVTVENAVTVPPPPEVTNHYHNHVTVPERHVTVENAVTVPPPPEVTNHYHSHVTVPERHVTVENAVHVPEREVHVDARTTVPERAVTIENQVTVPERPVTVENTVNVSEQPVYVDNKVVLPENKPPAKVTETIIRDHQGEIQQIVRETEEEKRDG